MSEITATEKRQRKNGNRKNGQRIIAVISVMPELCPQKGERIVTIDSVTSFHPMYHYYSTIRLSQSPGCATVCARWFDDTRRQLVYLSPERGAERWAVSGADAASARPPALARRRPSARLSHDVRRTCGFTLNPEAPAETRLTSNAVGDFRARKVAFCVRGVFDPAAKLTCTRRVQSKRKVHKYDCISMQAYFWTPRNDWTSRQKKRKFQVRKLKWTQWS